MPIRSVELAKCLKIQGPHMTSLILKLTSDEGPTIRGMIAKNGEERRPAISATVTAGPFSARPLVPPGTVTAGPNSAPQSPPARTQRARWYHRVQSLQAQTQRLSHSPQARRVLSGLHCDVTRLCQAALVLMASTQACRCWCLPTVLLNVP